MNSGHLQRGLVGLVIAATGAFAPACDTPITLENAVPRVTWVAVEPLGGATARVTVWISDAEGDSVDLDIGWVGADNVATPLSEAPGSYGTLGLPTREALFNAAGQPHQILWDTAEVGGTVRLRMTPDDRPTAAKAGAGPTVETPAFELATGLPEPVLTEIAQ